MADIDYDIEKLRLADIELNDSLRKFHNSLANIEWTLMEMELDSL